MIKIYGSSRCPKTVKVLAICEELGFEADYRGFEENLKNLWEFVVLRDSEEALSQAKANKRLGIPFISCDNGFSFDGGLEPFDAPAVRRKIIENRVDG